jgi:Predicted Peptidoglycan domain
MAHMFDICLAFTCVKKAATSTTPPIPGAPPTWGSPWRPTGNGPTTPISVTFRSITCRRRRGDLPIALLEPAAGRCTSAGRRSQCLRHGCQCSIWRSARLLQQALGFTGEDVDGSIGPETLAAANRFDARRLVNNLADRQTAYYRSLANFRIFGTGWLRRTNARRDAALAMIQSEMPVAA